MRNLCQDYIFFSLHSYQQHQQQYPTQHHDPYQPRGYGNQPSSAAYGDETDTSKDYDDLYANVKNDESKLNLGDYITEIEPGEGGIPGGMTTVAVLVLVSESQRTVGSSPPN